MVDRFDIVKYITNATTKDVKIIAEMDMKLKEHKKYIADTGVDPDWITNI